MHIGNNIARMRAAKQIKQSLLAQQLGISQQTYSKIEQKEYIEEELLEQIARVLDTPKEIFYQESLNLHSNNQQGSILYSINFNPMEKIIELYDKLVKCEQIIQELRAENVSLRYKTKSKN